MADYLGKTHGLSMVVENRAGAAEVIGTEAVARAAPDGNTMLFGSSQVVINPQLRKVNYHPLESFEPVCLMVEAPLVFSVQSSSPYRTLNDLLDAARAKPGSITMGSLGPGTPFDIGLAMLKQRGQGRHHLRAVQRQWSLDQRAFGRTRDLDVQQLLQRLQPAQSRPAAPACRRQQDADPAAAGRADRDRVRGSRTTRSRPGSACTHRRRRRRRS